MFSMPLPTFGRAAYLYSIYECARVSAYPFRAWVKSLEPYLNNPGSPMSVLPVNRSTGASWRVLDELTRRYHKPDFGIHSATVEGVDVPVQEIVVERSSFSRLLQFRKSFPGAVRQPKVLIIAPLSGHFATLVRGTIAAMLPEHDVYVTDWNDARTVPLLAGRFDLHDFIDQIMEYFRTLGPDLHVIAVCQPSVAALAATALLAEDDDPGTPRSLTLMAGPVDTDRNPTMVNRYSQTRSIAWFRNNVITLVPPPNPGALRAVYPGFLQLAGFMGMNMDSHMTAYQGYFRNLVKGDADSTEAHRRFYDEYLAVMDMPAEFFLQTVDLVFHKRALAEGTLVHRGREVRCDSIRSTTLMTVEGENDDICGLGQTEAAHDLCSSIPADLRHHYVQPGVGHYGVFNGRRWRTEIQPRIAKMIRSTQ